MNSSRIMESEECNKLISVLYSIKTNTREDTIDE